MLALLGFAAAAAAVELRVTYNPDRSSALPLQGAMIDASREEVYVFTTEEPEIERVYFYLDTPSTGNHYHSEGTAPYDLAGTRGGRVPEPFQIKQLANGEHFIEIRVTFMDGKTEVSRSTFTVQGSWTDAGEGTAPTFTLVHTNADRSNPQPLSGAALTGNAYIALDGRNIEINSVTFYLDENGGSPDRVERNAPYDFNGGNGAPDPLDTKTLSDGQHTMRAFVYTEHFGVIEAGVAVFIVRNTGPSLTVDASVVGFDHIVGDPDPAGKTVTVSATSGAGVVFTVSESGSWLAVPTAGTTPGTLPLNAVTTGLAVGYYSTVVTASAMGHHSVTFEVVLNVKPQKMLPPPMNSPMSQYTIMVSADRDKMAGEPLDGKSWSLGTNTGVYIYLTPEKDVKQVQFFVNVQGSNPFHTENWAPYDLLGGDAYFLNDAVDGVNTIWATVVKKDGSTENAEARFTIGQAMPAPMPAPMPGPVPPVPQVPPAPTTRTIMVALKKDKTDGVPLDGNGLFNEGVYVYVLPEDNVQKVLFYLNVQGSRPYKTENNAPYDLKGGDPWDLKDAVLGVNTIWATVQQVNGPTENLVARFNVEKSSNQPPNQPPNQPSSPVKDPCWPVICSQIRVPLPYTNSFNADQGHILDKNGVGTGLTHILTPAAGKGTGYVQNNLEMDLANGHLKITTTAGIHHKDNDDADNNIGIGYAGPNSVAIVQCTLVKPVQVPTTGGYEQAGLYLGWDQNNYVKLTYVSTPNKGHIIEFAMELAGVRSRRVQRGLTLGADEDLTLRLVVDPFALTVASSFARSRAPGKFQGITTWNEIPDEFYSYDAAGIDPIIGTRTFTGIWATHRNGPAPVTYTFSDFSVTKPKPTQPPTEPKCGGATFEFDRKSYSVPLPTAMVWGPDGRLYVAELFGRVHALTYNKKMNVVNDEVIKTLEDAEGKRMTLGITIGPDSTAGSIDLYLCHSSASVQNGGLNSGMVTRLYGTGFRQYTHVITGLPRAIANHGPNSLHFGRDRKLYIAIGGNTGAGSLTEAKTEFRDRPEQPLSAAIVVADVFKAGFNGACHATTSKANKVLGDPKCDVEAYGTGLRNSYDFVEHSNGKIYATDNGLGVTGAYPPQTTGNCGGAYTKSDTKNWKKGGNNPGIQTDWLFLIKKGKYYGHPNPSRKECIFMDGSYQKVKPTSNYERPIADLGKHASANGIIEYQGDAGGGYLKGALLYTRYSAGDDVRAILLSKDGTKVTKIFTLAKDFVDPLTLTQNNKGDLFVAEFGSNKVTALRPKGQCTEPKWQTLPKIPKATLDPASASVGSKLFVIGGKQGNAHFNTAYSYDVGTKKWKKIADKPGSAVENAACVGFRGKVYHFGGSEEPFSKAVNEAFVFDVATGVWSAVAALPTARGGAVAEVVGDEIYVIGGMLASGVSVTTVEIYKPSTNTWRTGVPLQEVRDNPGAEVIDGKIYVIGGRHRQDGREVDGTKASCEVFDPATKKWTYIAPMPTGRRTMVTGVMGGQLYSIGGERNRKSTNELFNVNERYDPATNTWTALAPPPNARHGAAYSVIGETLYVVGGGVVAGSAATDLAESF